MMNLFLVTSITERVGRRPMRNTLQRVVLASSEKEAITTIEKYDSPPNPMTYMRSYEVVRADSGVVGVDSSGVLFEVYES